jgi:hypothetical protein
LKAHTAQPGKKKPVAATTNESVRSVQIMKKNAGQIIHLIKAGPRDFLVEIENFNYTCMVQ